MKIFRPFKKVWRFYADGFRNMPAWGRKVWLIIILKGVVVFIFMKLVFFPNQLNKDFDTDEQRSEYVLDQLTKNK